MGRLFWKFFFIFWLAQLATSIGVGISIWLHNPRDRPPFVAPESRFEPGRTPDPRRWQTSSPRDRLPTGAMPPRPPPHEPSWLPPLMPLLAGSVVSLLFAALLARYFSKPIRHLREAFDAAANGQLDTRLAPAMGSRRDELADLGRDFDRMTERLQSLMNSQRRLLHDVSHELRSPLARLQVAVGLLRQRPEKLEDSMDRIERESVRMDKLVSELLTLSRLEAGMVGNMDEDFELNEVIASVTEDARYEAGTRDCQVILDERYPATLHGNAELLHRALDNVIRNAIKHSPAGGNIDIRIAPHPQGVSITIGDSGQGVAEAELQAIFEPFFRSDKANTTEGHGLGLAIAHRIIRAHQGSIHASNQPTGGLLVEMVLPVG